VKKAALLLLILGLIGLGAHRLFTRDSTRRQEVTTTVARLDDIRSVVQCVGAAEPVRKLDVKSLVPGRVEQIVVEEGDLVQKGALIARIEATEYQLEVQRAEAEVEAAKERLAQARLAAQRSRSAGEQPSVALAQATSRAAKAKLDGARDHLALLQELEHRADAAEARRAAANAALVLAKQDLDRKMQLLNRGFVAAAEVDEARADHDAAQAELRAAEQDLVVIQAEVNVQRREAQTSVSVSTQEYEASLEAVEQARSEAAIKRKHVDEAAADLRRAQVALAAARQQLSYTELRAPMAGQVIYKGVEEGETVSPEGRGAATGTVIATIASTEGMIVHAEVDDTDIGKVSVGQQALLSVGAGEREPYHGEVVYIAGRSTIREGEVPTFRVKLIVKDPDQHLRPGMTANVDIACQERRQVVVVPYGAVRIEGGQATVQVLSGGKPVTRSVRVGIITPTAVEIAQGIKAGDTVVTGVAQPVHDK